MSYKLNGPTFSISDYDLVIVPGRVYHVIDSVLKRRMKYSHFATLEPMPMFSRTQVHEPQDLYFNLHQDHSNVSDFLNSIFKLLQRITDD